MNKLDLEETTRRFHNIYEQVAKEYGYKTREDTKELDFNSPNGMTMLKTVEMITTPYLDEIERLKTELQDTKEHLGEYLHEQEEGNKRLNNILNRIEETLEIRIKLGDKNIDMILTYKRVLELIKEIRGDSKLKSG